MQSKPGNGRFLEVTVEAIKNEIESLPEEQKTALAVWLARLDSENWDRQIERDFSTSGAGADLLATWDQEIDEGQSILLEEFLEQRETDLGK